MPYYFYKAVPGGHILGQSLLRFEQSAGIKGNGLDPQKRNASGGATVVAMAQSGRQLSASDATNVGQCLTGNIDYAKGYCTTDNHVVLRITLQDADLATLVEKTATHASFASMNEAVEASECTSIAVIPPTKIEYSIEAGWEPIANYNHPPPKEWWDGS